MEPIKFEDNIREKFEEREIAPSKDAWKKLHSKLDPRPNKNTNRFIWFAVAASFIGILIIASLLFNDDGSSITNTSDKVVETKEKTDKIDEKIENLLVEDKNNSIVSEETKLSEKAKNQTIKEPVEFKKSISGLAEISTNSIKEATTTSIVENSETTNTVIIANEDLLINSKVDEEFAQVQDLQKDNKAGSIVEINALLLKAQQDIQNGKIAIGKKKKVDATALLNAVETDLETSFRDKIFDALGDGIEKVKTAVVERNN